MMDKMKGDYNTNGLSVKRNSSLCETSGEVQVEQ